MILQEVALTGIQNVYIQHHPSLHFAKIVFSRIMSLLFVAPKKRSMSLPFVALAQNGGEAGI